jgi:signal transduction histidine kinase
VELLRFKAAEKNQQIVLEMIETPVELFISREKIWRVISNLISNAIKFSRPDSLIQVGITDAGKKVIISVKDSGIGIPHDIRDKVFNMFTDAKRIGTAGERSFGLGLSICKQIVENHHGKIWFESEVNKGTTFFVALNKP